MTWTLKPVLLLTLTIVAASATGPAAAKGEKQYIVLDGVQERVNWSDGDSFRIIGGKREGQKARLVGYNTPESYGPVHFWGDANGWDIYRVHLAAKDFVKTEEWECTSSGAADGYGRILVTCPELRKRLIRDGLAHVYAYKDEPDPELVKLMHEAQNARVGMWKYGIPRGIVTSIHSIDEPKGDDDFGDAGKKSYNRIADTATGKTFPVEHEAVFKPCDVFCYAGSCMIYIPFKMRYGDERPACAMGKEGEKNRMDGPGHLDEPLKGTE